MSSTKKKPANTRIPEAFRANPPPALAADTLVSKSLPAMEQPLWPATARTALLDTPGPTSRPAHIPPDITNRLLANQSEDILHRFIDHAPVAIAMFDRAMNYLAASQRWLRDHGLAGQNVIGRSHYKIFPELPARWKLAHQRGLAGELVQEEQDHYQRADGTNHWLRWELQPWRDQAGNIGGIVIFTEDLTERERLKQEAETALRATHERLSRVLAVETVGVMFWDPVSGVMIDANDTFLNTMGYSRREMEARVLTWQKLTPPEYVEISREEMRKFATTGRVGPYEKEYLRKDGTRLWFVFAGSKLTDGSVVEFCVDITARKQAENLLHQANRTLRAIRNCHEAMLRAETEPALLNEICRIIVETGGERMAWVGYAQNDGQKSVKIMAATGGKKYLTNLRVSWADTARGRGPTGTAIRTGETRICQNTQTDPGFAPWRDSARRHGFGSTIALPLIVEGRCIGALAIYAHATGAFDADEQLLLADLANDLSFGIAALRLRAERTRLEDEILKSIEREQERIGRDLHDGLCQLLVGAKFRCGFLQNISPRELSAAREEAKTLEAILNTGIAQARNMARGLNPVNVTPMGLSSALQKLAEDVSSLGHPGCACKFFGSVKIPDHHTANHLYRIAQEALQNALKHSGAKNITIALGKRGRSVVLTIKDDGVGVPAQVRESGMGLSNMRMRASLIGGRLDIRRRKSRGTAVSCEFSPRSQPQTTNRKKSPAKAR